MDLSNAEKTLSELEENSKKISEITKSIEKFKKISQELSSLPDDIAVSYTHLRAHET